MSPVIDYIDARAHDAAETASELLQGNSVLQQSIQEGLDGIRHGSGLSARIGELYVDARQFLSKYGKSIAAVGLAGVACVALYTGVTAMRQQERERRVEARITAVCPAVGVASGKIPALEASIETYSSPRLGAILDVARGHLESAGQFCSQYGVNPDKAVSTRNAGEIEPKANAAASELSSASKSIGHAELAVKLEAKVAEAKAIAREDTAVRQIDVLRDTGFLKLDGGDISSVLDRVEALRAVLSNSYKLMVYQPKPGQSLFTKTNGVVDSNSARYYVIVQAVDPAGQPVKMTVRNTDGVSEEKITDQYGIWIPKCMWDLVAADYNDNKQVDNKVFAEKQPGFLAARVMYNLCDANTIDLTRTITRGWQ